MSNDEVRKLTNDDLVRHAREKQKKSIRACSERAADKIISKLPKTFAQKIDRAVLAELIEAEFLSGLK
jgi:hypothetical protein